MTRRRSWREFVLGCVAGVGLAVLAGALVGIFVRALRWAGGF
jgi:hypothetical protein